MIRDKLYTTGEIAKMAGVTIRTIRYYDTKGILKPSHHTDAGHRLYSEEDFIKLKKILALKYLGLSLDEVMNTENSDFEKDDMVNSLQIQKSIIQNKINHMKTVLEAIETAENSIEKDENLDWRKTVDIIKILEDEKDLRQQYIDVSNLNAEIKLQDRFSLDKYGWYRWTFKNFKFDKGYKVLEIGCGNGALWSKNIEVLEEGIEVVLTEVCEDILNEAKKNLNNYSDRFTFQISDPSNIPYEDESFDIIIANHILFYMKDIDKVLLEINRLLKKNGYFYCSTIDDSHMKELEELIMGYSNNITISKDKLVHNFGLKNVEEILENYFKDISKYLYKDTLIVNNTKGILEYIYSIPGNILDIIETKKKDFEKYIDKSIKQSENSELHITNQSVLFESRKI